MSQISMKQLLEAGVHFGHQTRRWNPKMKQYIFGARNGIYIIDLQKTVQLFKVAYEFLVETTEAGHSVLFVGTKKQAQEAIYEESTRAGMYYVNQRWLGGMLTNFQTIKQSIERLKKLEAMKEDDSMSKFPKKEILKMERHMQKLERNLGGIKNMDRLPGAVFVIDPRRENIAVAEARRLNIPVVAVVDTNCDPDDIDYVIPGNDDAIRAIRLMASSVANACLEGNERAKEKAAAAAEEEILVEEAPEDMDVQVSPDTKPYISDLPKEQRNLPQVEPEIIVVKSELVETEADTAPADTDAPVEADAPAEAEVAEPEAPAEEAVEKSAEESPEE